MSDCKRPSFRVRPEPTGFDIYRADPFAEIIVSLRQDYAGEVSSPEELWLYLDAYIDDRVLTEEQAKDIFLIVMGGLEVPVVECGTPDELFIVDGLIGGITKYIIENSHRPQDEMALLMAIQVAGIVLARRLISETGDTPNLYQIITGPSGSGKDAARQLAILLLTHACGSHLLGPESVTSAASIIALASICPAVLFLIDEVGKIISAIKSRNAGNTEREIETLFLKLWSSALNRKFRHQGDCAMLGNLRESGGGVSGDVITRCDARSALHREVPDGSQVVCSHCRSLYGIN